LILMDSRLRGNDGVVKIQVFCESIFYLNLVFDIEFRYERIRSIVR